MSTPRYIVMSRAAQMPSSIRVPYRRVALVKTDLPAGEPTMISTHAKGVLEILEVYERQHLGYRPRGNTAAERAARELQARADRLNQEACHAS